ncbi:MAG: hypothetical protein ACLRSD_10235 [Oscillibacter sp.]
MISLSFLKSCVLRQCREQRESPASAAGFPQRKPIAKTKANIAAISAADLNFRVTTLLAEKTAARPLPEWIGERTLLTVGDRLRLLGVCAFTAAAHRGWPARSLLPFCTTNGSLKAVIRGSRILLKAFDE